MRATLEGAGYEVLRAADGEQCLALARAEVPDVLVLDLMMPKLHGLDVLEQLRADAATAAMGVIVCSAKDYKTEIEQVRDLGAIDFLPKPVPRRQLIEVIGRFLAERDGVAPAARTDEVARGAQRTAYRPRIRPATVAVRLWGTRGSTPVSGPCYVRHGGNTTCMELTHGDEVVLFDAGSGIRDASARLMAGGPRRMHLFISHTHWDHIQGFPFFVPAYVPGFEIVIHAPHNIDKDVESIFRGQLDRAYFPVQMEDMQAEFRFEDLGDEPIRIGDIEVTWAYAMHPGAAVGYRIDVEGRSVVFFPDNEFMKGFMGDPVTLRADDEQVVEHRDQLRLMRDADLLIHEAQYTHEEYAAKIGWGHTSVGNACALVRFAGAKHWVITHHDPDHSDDVLQDKLSLTRQILGDLDCSIDVHHAFDGMVEYL